MEKLRERQRKTLKNSVCCFLLFLYLHDVLFCFCFLFFLWKGMKHLHALPSEQLQGKVAGTCSKQLWLIILSLILFYTWLYNRPVLQSLSFPSLCYVIIVFVSNHWKVFFVLKLSISQRFLGVDLSRKIFANNYW